MIVHLYFSHSIIHCFYDISGLSQNLPAASPHSDITHDTKGNFTHNFVSVYSNFVYNLKNLLWKLLSLLHVKIGWKSLSVTII